MDERKPDKGRIAMGLLFLAVGVMPLVSVLGLLPAGQASPDAAPAWIGWLIGLMFVGAGLYILLTAFTGDNPSGATAEGRMLGGFRELLSLAIVGGLALLASWVAFGPGPRHFSVGFGGSGVFLSGGGDRLGRVAFGAGAVITWCAFALFLIAILRRRR